MFTRYLVFKISQHTQLNYKQITIYQTIKNNGTINDLIIIIK